MRRLKHEGGQAVVEFALAATLIFMMLAASVDLGLVFFSLQGMNNAAQEGATYGSRWLLRQSDGTPALDLNGIRDRVRHEAGAKGGIGFVNLLDLNNNKQIDATYNGADAANIGQSGAVLEQENGAKVVESYIIIEGLTDTDADGAPNVGETCTGNALTSQSTDCFVQVTVRYNYKPVFPLAPVIGNGITISSTYFFKIRDKSGQGGAITSGTSSPSFSTATASPTLTPSPTNTPAPSPTQETFSISINSFVKYNNKTYIRVLVTRPNGQAVTDATVKAGSVTLTSAGNGYYVLCAGSNSLTSATITATNSIGSGSASGSRSNSSSKPSYCS